jgi:hypothetical protein
MTSQGKTSGGLDVARARRRPSMPRSLGSCWYTIEIAAAKLDLEPQALRARCRRGSRSEEGEIVARLGMGVVARKLGKSWRVYVPSPEEIADAV